MASGQPLSVRLPLAAVLTALTLAPLFASCAPSPVSKSDFTLGTLCTVTIYDRANAKTLDKVFAAINEVDAMMNVNERGGGVGNKSELEMLNGASGGGAVSVREALFSVIERALFFANLTDGAFNPALGPVIKLWGIGTEGERVPSGGEIEAALGLSDYRDVELQAEGRLVTLKRAGMALDLGGIAKGYAVDRARDALKAAGVKRAIIDLGGDIYALGAKSAKQKWRVGIQDPQGGRGAYISIEEAADCAVVTSGTYERFFESGGVVYHHILGLDGYPAQNSIASVTVIGASAMDADALSTALFVLGYEKSESVLEKMPDYRAVFVFDDGAMLSIP